MVDAAELRDFISTPHDLLGVEPVLLGYRFLFAGHGEGVGQLRAIRRINAPRQEHRHKFRVARLRASPKLVKFVAELIFGCLDYDLGVRQVRNCLHEGRQLFLQRFPKRRLRCVQELRGRV